MRVSIDTNNFSNQDPAAVGYGKNFMVNFVNCCLHPIALNDGRLFQPSGHVARVAATYSEFEDDICLQGFGAVEGLPEPQEGTVFIVSALVLGALNGSRPDVVAPASGHPLAKRDGGNVVSVPGFVRL